ncbi:MAG TPA: hypothetical protein VKA85_04060 [Candidatus Limnocylindrales bacterium]|nr:hypothetical protein [Candidatus Limnocylindrales bacterium]
MSTNSDRRIFEFLDTTAGRGSADYLNQVLTRTSRTRQRPAWVSIERWLPIDALVARTGSTPSAALRSFALLVAVAILIAALIAIVVGSHRVLPPPYGLARNGELVATANGDVFAVDPATGTKRPLIAGPEFDFSPMFSRDGTKFLVLRAATGCGEPECGLTIVVANSDGTGAREIIPPVPGLDIFDWSPDGRQIVYLSRPEGIAGHVINVVNSDGTGRVTLDVHRPANLVGWLPPSGTEIIFRGEQASDGDPLPGIFTVHPDGSGLRPITLRPALNVADYQDISVSPDGTRIAYREDALAAHFRVHILDLGTGSDIVLPMPAGVDGQTSPGFSPDGLGVAYLRVYPGAEFQLVVAPADGSGLGTELGPRGSLGQDGPSINSFGFTPDGKALLANYDDERATLLLPLDGSRPSVVSEGDMTFAAYQRLAP